MTASRTLVPLGVRVTLVDPFLRVAVSSAAGSGPDARRADYTRGAMLRVVVTVGALVIGCGRLAFEPAAVQDAAPDAPAVCTTGLLGYWPLDANDLVAGAVRDRSGSGHDGTVIGAPAPTIVRGVRGDALAYAATGDAYVDMPSIPFDAAPAAAVTISLWFWRDPTPPVDDALVYLPQSPKYDLWLTYDGNPDLHLCFNTASGDCWGIIDNTLLGRWVHVVAIFRNGPSTDSTLYIDGAPRTLACLFGSCVESRTASGPFTLGGSDAYEWHGRFDEVRIHDRALDEEDVATLYADACPPGAQ